MVDLPAGAALDVGCGSGNIIAQIATRTDTLSPWEVAREASRQPRGGGQVA
jgi:hypothetical protein